MTCHLPCCSLSCAPHSSTLLPRFLPYLAAPPALSLPPPFRPPASLPRPLSCQVMAATFQPCEMLGSFLLRVFSAPHVPASLSPLVVTAGSLGWGRARVPTLFPMNVVRCLWEMGLRACGRRVEGLVASS